MSTDWSDIDNRLLDPHWYVTEDYHEVFARLRREDPVHWTENDWYGRHHWTLTRHDHIKEYLLNHEMYSSRWDTRVPVSPKRRTPEVRHAQGWDVGVGTTDNPLHDLYRRPINKHFSVPAIGRMREDIESLVDEILGEVAGNGSCDIVADVAGEMPLRVIMRLLGIPESDWAYLRENTARWREPADPRWIIDGDRVKTAEQGLNGVMEYCTELAMQRRREPRDDFATVIGNLEIDGDKLSIHEMKAWFSAMIAAGLETTRNGTSVGIWLFLTHPEQRRLMAEDPGLVKGAVEEVLRWTTPTRNRLRIANADHDFHGKRIRAGDWVVAMLPAANRDEEVFENPNAFDITRSPNEHLSFGMGIHMCLGRALARLEMATLFPRLFEVMPDIEMSEEPTWIVDTSATGFATMPVTFTPTELPARS